MNQENMGKGFILIFFLSISCAFMVNTFSPAGIALFGQWDKTQGVVTAKPKNHDVVVNEIEIRDVLTAKNMYDTGKYIFIDARTLDSFDEGHIKDAVSMPVNEFFDNIESFIEKYPLTTHFITYCSGRDCLDSHELAQFLSDEGYKVNVFIDGYPAWEKEGFPVE